MARIFFHRMVLRKVRETAREWIKAVTAVAWALGRIFKFNISKCYSANSFFTPVILYHVNMMHQLLGVPLP